MKPFDCRYQKLTLSLSTFTKTLSSLVSQNTACQAPKDLAPAQIDRWLKLKKGFRQTNKQIRLTRTLTLRMATFAAGKLSRVVVTKQPSPIRRVLPLANFGSTVANRNRHQEQHQVIGPGCRYDRAEQQQPPTARNKMLLSTTTAAFPLLSSNNEHQTEKVGVHKGRLEQIRK